MTTAPDTYEPIPVILHNPEALRPAALTGITLATIVLTAQDPVQQLLPLDPLRDSAHVLQGGDQDIVICHSKADAQAASNSTASLPNPTGALILKTFLHPVPLPTTARVLVTAQAFPARVSVIISRHAT